MLNLAVAIFTWPCYVHAYLQLDTNMKAKFLFPLLSLLLVNLCCRKSNNDGPRIINDDKDVVLEIKPRYNNPRNSEGDFITLKDGRILFVYTKHTGKSYSDDSAAYLAGRYSRDSGRTWESDDHMVVAQEGKMNVMSVSLLRLQNGNIAMFYLVKNTQADSKPYVRISTNEGATWSNSVNCIKDKSGFFVVNNNRVIQLKSGRVVLPVSLHQDDEEPDRNHLIGRISAYYSDDNCKTWHASTQVPNPRKILIQEPGIIELKDGKILMLMRTNQKRQFMSYSYDQGKTWSGMATTQLKSPVSPASLARIPSTGDLMVIWNNNDNENTATFGFRNPFNLAISKDEGRTWIDMKTIENNSDGMYCYTAIHFVGNHVLLGHCAGMMSKTQGLCVTNITRLSIKWIYQ